MRTTTDASLSDEIKYLAKGPYRYARRFKGYIINGFHFRIKGRDKRRTNHNSDIILNASTTSYAIRRDKNPRTRDVTYYGELIDIIEIRYTNDMKFVMFKCNWIDNNVGMKRDEFKFTLVNFNHLLYKENRITDEPFIMASQAEQVWYVQDPLALDWHVVVKTTSRDYFDMYSKDFSSNIQVLPQVEPYNSQQLDESINVRIDDVAWVREGVEGTIVDVTSVAEDDTEIEDMD